MTSWVAHPQGLLLVHQAPRVGDFLHGLLLLLLLLFFLLVILLDLLDVGIVIIILVGLVIGVVLLGGLLDP